MTKEFPKRKNLRLKGFDYSIPHVYSITTCTRYKSKIFKDDSLNREIIDCISHQRQRFAFKVFCYCLMPNHLHLLLTPPGSGSTVSEFMNAFKSTSTKLCWKHGITGKVWQGRFYDYILRKTEDIETVAEYILYNPVRKGFVKDWQDYGYCGLIDPMEK